MITCTFPAAGGTPWDDLEQDRPWDDPAVLADRADWLAEQFGPVPAGEACAGPVLPVPAEPPARRIIAGPAALVDHDLVCAARRRTLDRALARDRARCQVAA